MLPYHIESGYFCLILAIFLNGLLIHLVVHYTKAPIGNYRYFLIGMAVYEIIYAASHAFISPMLYTQPGILLVLPINPLLFNAQISLSQILIVYMESTYAATMIMLTSHFLYRYITICKKEYSFLFETLSGFSLSGLSMLSLAFLWGFISWICFNPSNDRSRKIESVLEVHFNLHSNETAYTLVEYWDIESGAFIPTGWIGMTIIGAICGVCFICIAYCGYHTYREISSHQKVMSQKLRALQKQLFYSLTVLTLVPVFTIYCPALCVFWGPALGIGVGELAVVTPLAGSLNPLIDPIVIIYFIGDYRRGVRLLLFRGKPRGQIDTAEYSHKSTDIGDHRRRLPPISASVNKF